MPLVPIGSAEPVRSGHNAKQIAACELHTDTDELGAKLLERLERQAWCPVIPKTSETHLISIVRISSVVRISDQ